MKKTLFIASFPDLSIFDFSKTGISVCMVDNSDYFFSRQSDGQDYIPSYVASLKNKAGMYDIVFVPTSDKVISSLLEAGIKCIVLYPEQSSKEDFIADLQKARVEEEYISMVENSWDFIISRLDKHNYDYKLVMNKDDKILDILKSLLSKKNGLGSDANDLALGINEDLVNETFNYCLLNENEFKNGEPDVASIFCEGIKYDYMFSADRLAEKRDIISSLIDSINAIDEGISVGSMDKTKDGKIWTSSVDTLEKVMALGISNGDLLLPFPREFDHSLKGELPYVIKKKRNFGETQVA